MPKRTPTLFVSHGAPSVVLERDEYTDALAGFGEEHGSLRGIVLVSAHWEWPGPLRVNASAHPELIYDFSGFPAEMYAIDYPAPGAPDLAEKVVTLLQEKGIHSVEDRSRGWDHGLWVPLRLAYPQASAPVVEISLPIPRSPSHLLETGRALSSLREEGVLLVGSGGVVHNLSRLHWGDREAPVSEWAQRFDEWVATHLEHGEFAEILHYAERAPHASWAVPTTEHFDPIFFTLGATLPEDRFRSIYDGFVYGTLSMRAFAFGPAS